MPTAPDRSQVCQPETYGLPWPTAQQAQQVFAQLEVQGQVLRQALAGTQALSPYGRGEFSGSPAGLPQSLPSPTGGPRRGPGGAILHFTAGPTLESAVKWFCDPAQQSGRCAHLVIARGREDRLLRGPWTAACRDATDLPATVVQCRLPTTASVAGAWTNGAFFQVELCGWGCDLAGAPARDQVGWWPLAGRRWQPYTARQLATAIYLLRCVRAAFGDFPANRVWGHEHVQTVATPGSLGVNKLDTGPLLPWGAVRAGVARPGEVLDLPAAGNLVDQVLDGLGYGPGRGPGGGLRVAQYSLGLQADGVPGPITQAALAARVGERLGRGPLTWAQLPGALPALAERSVSALTSLDLA